MPSEFSANDSLVLNNAVLATGKSADVLVSGGVIAQIGDSVAEQEGIRRIDLQGRLLCPGFVDGHIHLDKTLMGAPWVPHVAGNTVEERIAHEKAIRQRIGVPVETRALALVEQVIRRGSTWLRSHVDVDPELGLANLEAILSVREQVRERISIQLVAFPQSGVLAAPGTAELLEEAMKLGADHVGGLDPAAIDGDANGQLDLIFGLAERYGTGVDIHLHDPGDLGLHELRLIAERTRALGLGGRVAVSHAYALGMVDEGAARATADDLAGAGVAIMTAASGFGAMPPMKLLLDAGVRVFAGSDNIRDAWSPLGNGDMLERAMLVAYRANMKTDEDLAKAYALATHDAAAALGIEAYGLKESAPADLVALAAPSVPQAVAEYPPRDLVIKAGCVVWDAAAVKT